ncbi:MAG TPA: AI-2E family transporter [Candidatus Binatia bacterium]|nr:AI-2E family transporter [Candidatus Binatia bacterium]
MGPKPVKARLQQTKPAEARPDIRQFMELFQGPLDVRSVALTGIFLLLCLYTLYFARDVFLPVVLAYILSSLLAPAVRWLKRIHIAELAGAGLVLSVVLGLSAYGVYRLSDPAMEWVQEAPQTLAKVRAKLRGLAGPVEQAKETTKELEKMTWGATQQDNETVEVKKPGLGEYIFSGTQTLIFTVGVTIVLLYFLLASGDLFLLKLVKVLPTLEDKKRAVEICREIERDISKYLWTVTLVNAGLGIAVGLTMYFLGMPNPALWGVMAAFLNYIPYLGALIGIVVIAIAATLTFDDPVLILAAPSAYFLWQIIESYFITPLALGRSLALNPVIIFVWLIFWGWIWGVAGALLAVPLLAMLKIICHHFDAFAPLAEFLGGEQ